MADSPRLIRSRIRSVVNTRKITKAMELVAAAKMRKAVSAVLATRPYAESAWRAVEEIARATEQSAHPLLQPGRTDGPELLILFAPDRGLCGGVISQLNRTVNRWIDGLNQPPQVVAVGRKAVQFASRRGLHLEASFDGLTKNPRIAELRPVARLATDDFVAGKYRGVWLAFTDYKSAAAQEPVVRPLLPLGRIAGLGEADRGLRGIERPDDSQGEEMEMTGAEEFLFEPSPGEVLDLMLPRLAEVQVWQALLESLASEHAARMMAMRSASDAASDMIQGLTLSLNQARQAAITQEIAEISSGKAALG